MTAVRSLLGVAGAFAAVPEVLGRRALFNGQNGDGTYKIFEATSSDRGLTWAVLNADAAVISPSGSGFVSVHVKDPWLMPDGLVCFASGYNGTRYQTARLTRADLSSAWVYDSTSTPVIALGGSGDPDEHGVAFPTMFDEGVAGAKRFKCWYRGEDASGKQTICYAYSPTGLAGSWTKVGRVLDVGAPGSWYDVGTGPGGIAKVGSTYHLLVGGRQSATAPVHWQTGHWSFTDPEGVYTANPANPTLPATWLTSGISQQLTANLATSGTVAHVASTAAWVDGQPVIVADGSSESEVHRITIDSSTQVTIDSPALSDFTTADGATMRPVEINSTWPRGLVQDGGHWELYWTPFQPLDDLGPGGNPLREMSMRAEAALLADVWDVTHAAGVLFPVYPAHTGAHKFSAENPSVIADP